METALPLNWSAILATHERWLRAVVYSRLRDGDAVDDVMQEVALAAIRQAAPIVDASKVAPWLYRLAVRQVLMYRRKMGRRRNLLNRFVEQRQTAGREFAQSEPLDWLLEQERGQLVRQSLQRLPDRDVEILLLKYSQQWSYGQIAQHLGVSHSAVEARLHRARARLRNELAAVEIGSQQ